MAATPLSVTSLTRDGITDTLSNANVDGHTIANASEKMWVEVLNGGGSSITVTFDITVSVDGQPVTDKAVIIAAGVRKKIGVFPKSVYNNGSDQVLMTFSSVTSVTCGAFSI